MKITQKMPVKNVINFHKDIEDLKDGVLERKSFLDVFTTDETANIIGVITKPTTDRDGDIIWPLGVSDKYYKSNPVVQFNHDLNSVPVGTIENYNITPEGIAGTFRFSDTYEFAVDIKNLIKEKILKGISIGFIPMKALKAGTDAFNAFAKQYGLDVSQCTRIITECEWIETSIVPIGCNPEALIIAAKKFGSDMTAKSLKIDTEVKSEVPEAVTEIAPEVIPETPIEETPKEITPEVTQDILIVEPTPEAPVPEAPKAPIITVLRRGPLAITEEIKQKALLFSQGKPF